MAKRAGSLKAMICGTAVLACTAPEALEPAPNAALVQTCAPWDGPAIALFLTDQPAVATFPARPYSAITIYRGLPEVLGHHFDVGPEIQDLGRGEICPATGECRPAQVASVTFGQLDADSTVQVTYRLEAPPERAMGGTGRARLHPATGFCG